MLMQLWCIGRDNYTHGALGRLVTHPFLRHPLMIHPLKTPPLITSHHPLSSPPPLLSPPPPSLFYHKNRSIGSRSHQRHRQRSNRRHQTKIRPSIARTTCGASLLFFTPLKPIHCSILLSTHPFNPLLPYLILPLPTHPINISY